MSNGVWTRRLSRTTIWLGVGSIVLAIGGAAAAGADLIPKTTGLYAMAGGGLLSVIGVIAGVGAVAGNLKSKTGLMLTAVIGLLLSTGYAGFMGSRAVVARGVPPIHDITTDITNPPAFKTLMLRADNLVGVETFENWQAVHAKAYSDIKTLTITKPVAGVIADAEKLARANGWDIATVDPVGGRLEATASVSLIKFKDDIVLRVTATPDGAGSVVDMRSVSRIGVSDLGVNAKRVRAFLADLAKA